ncbi:helix-turn-helix domain-containing protein [Nocardioides lacusdianchii]|uniref:helix-turn-helix domain-containing protein n=1 Tax=Nocardioides lacusdianchii TaxID=2783664 RepID=UPI001CCF30D5|nr:XRE family transcriptional regulator [Nocardioides lacusdianchii]
MSPTPQPKSFDRTAEIGRRIRRMRIVNGFDQADLAVRAGISAGLMSHIETGRSSCPPEPLDLISRALRCRPEFFTEMSTTMEAAPPLLRAYADAPKKELDRHLGEATTVVDVIRHLRLRRIPNRLPVFDGDLENSEAIEEFAAHVRVVADLEPAAVVGNATRLAERLGCVVLPMTGELGRHLGLSTHFGDINVICVGRPSRVPQWHVPGDRQRLTVTHELAHLVLHAGTSVPDGPRAAREVERQAFRFGAALLTPAEVMIEELDSNRGRVTLKLLAEIKSRWGVSIKMLVGRFRDLGVIDEDQARSLYKQISARGWTRQEPVEVPNETAIWLRSSLAETASGDVAAAVAQAANDTYLDASYFEDWIDWEPSTPAPPATDAQVIPLR